MRKNARIYTTRHLQAKHLRQRRGILRFLGPPCPLPSPSSGVGLILSRRGQDAKVDNDRASAKTLYFETPRRHAQHGCELSEYGLFQLLSVRLGGTRLVKVAV